MIDVNTFDLKHRGFAEAMDPHVGLEVQDGVSIGKCFGEIYAKLEGRLQRKLLEIRRAGFEEIVSER